MLTQKRRKCERGDCTFSYHDHITAVKWHDNRDVFAMSTFVSDKMTTVKRRKDSGPKVDISCPEMISDYNQFMGGVDLADQYMCSWTEKHEMVEKNCMENASSVYFECICYI